MKRDIKEVIGFKPLILIVEDNHDIQLYIKILLEHNECRVLTADNGKVALQVLVSNEETPDLIISDIMMPEMDGYDFFKAVSEDNRFLHIPFIFLSALDSPEDIRLGKLLGVDDYLTKPLNEDDLLVSVAGKILKNKKMANATAKLKELLSEASLTGSISEDEKEQVFLLKVLWDDIVGPVLDKSYPEPLNYPLAKVATQLYEAITTIFGQGKVTKAEGILINIENFKSMGYALFDSYSDPKFRGGERDYMFGVVAPRISYFQSLKIKEILKDLSNKFKKNESWNIEKYRKKIVKILSHTPI
ncbi:MAG: response regulator [Promethearchaeota archaeon]